MLEKIICLLDHTNLIENQNTIEIQQFCQNARPYLNKLAALCVYKEQIRTVREYLKKQTSPQLKIATVINYPSGHDTPEHVIQDIDYAIKAGADELDVVIPFQQYLKHDRVSTITLIETAKQHAKGCLIKVILESGWFQGHDDILLQACLDCLRAGADFLKTSTGKFKIGASLTAAKVMLDAIKQHQQETGKLCGIKISGGINSLEIANSYIDLAKSYFGEQYIAPQYFRFGSSSLMSITP